MAEINLGAGLGDVIAQTGKGIVLRTKPGAPGIGEIESFRKDVFIAYKTFGTIKTSDIISDPHHREVLSQVGLKYLELFEKETTLENFLSFSNSFSIETELMSDEVRNLVDYFNSTEDILGSSMAMLGNTVFAFGGIMGKFLSFGSLNLDYTYSVPHFVRAGETLAASERKCFCGGKGLNQSIALAHAGGVHHRGRSDRSCHYSKHRGWRKLHFTLRRR